MKRRDCGTTVPLSVQLVARIESLAVVYQREVCGIEAVVAVGLDKERRSDMEARLDQ